MNLQSIFPNSIIGQDIQGAYNVYDKNQETMGFVSDDVFWLRSDYEHWREAYLRLMENDITVRYWKESANAEKALKTQA